GGIGRAQARSAEPWTGPRQGWRGGRARERAWWPTGSGGIGRAQARSAEPWTGPRIQLTLLGLPGIARRVIAVGDALARVCAAARVLDTQRVGLDAALGRVAAEDVVSGRAVPAAANSAMDGFAVRHADLGTPLTRLRI